MLGIGIKPCTTETCSLCGWGQSLRRKKGSIRKWDDKEIKGPMGMSGEWGPLPNLGSGKLSCRGELIPEG